MNPEAPLSPNPSLLAQVRALGGAVGDMRKRGWARVLLMRLFMQQLGEVFAALSGLLEQWRAGTLPEYIPPPEREPSAAPLPRRAMDAPRRMADAMGPDALDWIFGAEADEWREAGEWPEAEAWPQLAALPGPGPDMATPCDVVPSEGLAAAPATPVRRVRPWHDPAISAGHVGQAVAAKIEFSSKLGRFAAQSYALIVPVS